MALKFRAEPSKALVKAGLALQAQLGKILR
jgi:hypothetical protein